MSQPQVVELVAQQQLLCTGEVEDVRGEWGTFPANIQQLEASGLTVFHPRGKRVHNSSVGRHAHVNLPASLSIPADWNVMCSSLRWTTSQFTSYVLCCRIFLPLGAGTRLP